MKIHRYMAPAIVLLLSANITSANAQDVTAPIIGEERQRIEENRKAQQQVNRVHEQTTELLSEYEEKLKVVDGLKVYNKLLARQLESQQAEVETLKSSIANATVIERQIMPLMMRMLDSLREFIALDMPFLLDEREQRIDKLQALMERADLTVAEKARRVFEAYQIENDYGRTLEAYKGKLDLEDRSFDADFLRIGRIALLYRTVGNDHFGYWDTAGDRWVETDESQFKRNLDKGLKIARQEMAPELFQIPVPPAEEMH